MVIDYTWNRRQWVWSGDEWRRAHSGPAEVGSASPRSRSIEQSMYISLCGVDPQYKLPVSMLERLSHPVSQTGPFVVVGPTVPAQQKSSFLAITFEQNIIGEIHESKTFEMSFDICWYLAFASQIDDVDVRVRTDIQTHKMTTVTLAVHARRGLKSLHG